MTSNPIPKNIDFLYFAVAARRTRRKKFGDIGVVLTYMFKLRCYKQSPYYKKQLSFLANGCIFASMLLDKAGLRNGVLKTREQSRLECKKQW